MRQDRPLFLGVSVRLGWRHRFCRRSIDRCRGPIHVAIARGGRTGIAATIRSRWKCRRGGQCPWRDWDAAAAAAPSWHPPTAARLERDRGNLSGQPREGGDEGSWSTGRPCVLTTMPMRMPKIGHVVASTGRIHNSRRQVVLPRRWNIDGRGRTNRLDHHISVSNGADPVFLLARFHRDFDG